MENLKQRLTTNWTFTRILYVVVGILMFSGSVSRLEWIGLLIGVYFTTMGLFSFGCASGSCSIPSTKSMDNNNL